MLPDFNDLWKLRPEADHNHTVIVRDRQTGEYAEKRIFRSYQSYLRVPGFDTATGKSYMFSGLRQEQEQFVPLPECLTALEEAVGDFDNCVINWYEPDDYIEMHSDCTAKLDPARPIVAFNLNEPGTVADRYFVVQEDGKIINEHLLTDGLQIVMPPGFQDRYKHGVGPGASRRISITFRKLK